MENDASVCRHLYIIHRFNSSSPFKLKPGHAGPFLVVQWLRYHTPNAGGLGSIPGQGTRLYMPQIRLCMPQPKTRYITTDVVLLLLLLSRFSRVQLCETP